MTRFENLELIYNQFFKLADEIKLMIEKEEYIEAIEKLKYKDKLIKKLVTVKKTVDFSDEDKKKSDILEEKLKEKEENNILLLKKIYSEVGEDLKKTKNKVKIGSAYAFHHQSQKGYLIDITE